MTLRQIGAVVVCAFALSISAAEAKQRQKKARIDSTGLTYCAADQTYRMVCPVTAKALQARATGRAAAYSGDGATIIGGRPAGCPRRYCGCGLARYLGLSDPRLNLAWNWARLFPRAHAAPGMAVVWRHHVALIVQMEGRGEALLRDYNSGGGLSRVHVRSIAGAVVVNPNSWVASR